MLAAPVSADAVASVHDQVRRRAQPALFIVDGNAAIESYRLPDADEWHRSLLMANGADFCEAVHEAVRSQVELQAAHGAEATTRDTMGPPSTILRVSMLSGKRSDLFAVTVERLQTRKTIEIAADRYGLSRREREVLALLLEGHGTTQVAEILNIASSTANDHVKRMLLKTNSRNRAELVARALGWDRFVHDL